MAPAARAAQLKVGLQAAVPKRAQSTASASVHQASAVEQSDSAYPAVVSLTSISPVSGSVTITGTVKNSGSSAISVDVGAAVDVQGGPLTRSGIASIAASTTPQSNDAPELSAPVDNLGSLAPGATSAPFTLTVSVSSLKLTQLGVYQLDVVATDGSSSASSSPQRLGILRTFLPYYTSGAKATEVATLWPLVDTPRVQPQQYDVTQSQQAVLTDDTLAAELGADGRLGQLESIGASATGLNLSWVIDPDLVSTVHSMSGSYRVSDGSSDQVATVNAGCHCTTAGTGSAAATSWLESLQTALTGLTSQQVISLPFADPDLALLAHHTADAQALYKSGSLTDAAGIGGTGLDLLKVTADDSVAWPYQGYIDQSVVNLAHTDLGDTQIIANSESLPTPSTMNYTPNAARSLSDGMTAVVADSTISNIFSGDLSTTSERVMAEQRFLAETLEITEERPEAAQPRAILIAPPRDMTASAADTLVAALQSAVSGKWIETVPYGTVAKATPTPGVGSTMTSYPSSVKGGEQQDLPDVVGVQSSLDELQKVIIPPNPYRAPFYAAILRSVSTAWRGQSQAGTDYLTNIREYMVALQGAVSIRTDNITLPGSSTATIPITDENNLPQTVTNLEVKLVSEFPNRLKIKSNDVQTVTVSGETKPSYKFQVQALVNGQVTMTAQLYTTLNGVEAFGPPVPFTVNVTQVSSGVIAVIAGGMLLVMLAGLRLYWKRKKNVAAVPAEGHDPKNGV